MYKLIYAYMYGGDTISAAIGYFDSEEKGLEAWNKCFNRENSICNGDPSKAMHFGGGEVDDKKREYTFSCCGWREWYRLEEFKAYKDNEVCGWGNHECTINTVDYSIKDAVRKLADVSASLSRSSLNYAHVREMPKFNSFSGPTVISGTSLPVNSVG